MILGVGSPEYRRIWDGTGASRWNGAYYYAMEIEERIVPEVVTDRPWVLVEAGVCWDRSIVFIHDNVNVGRYEYLSGYSDLILVCGVPETVPKVAHLGRAVYLPLSVDVAYVEGFRSAERSGTCYAGRISKACADFPSSVEYLSGMERPEFLRRMARFEYAYCVGRTAIEAKVLGCEVLPYDPRYPDPGRWEVLDTGDAARMLREMIG